MKFCKRYQEYMQKQEIQHLPGVGFKRFKKILKKCREEHQSNRKSNNGLLVSTSSSSSSSTSSHCPVCDGTFFPTLLKEMSSISCSFNTRAKKLLELHMATGVHKYLIWFRNKCQGNNISLVEEGKDLVTYATVNAIAIRKILKKYDKIHHSKQGQAFRLQARSMSIEILQSPWLNELIAFYINLRETKSSMRTIPGLLEECAVTFDQGKPSLSCVLFESLRLEIDLTCSICLETVFDAVSLTCSHILCYMCACSAASVTIVDGLKAANPKAKCPLCRKASVYECAVHLDELNILLKRSCPEYWRERQQSERRERVQQAKKHWENQCRAFMGI
ncbi:probable E3 ubiquitin-protein ligase BAH1-like 1 isoform X2 [Nymphaea colorata]|nr:probable E3 ubiquitin-protein ligase BAH1-like 1 isoform X2 [Nymphaea colorata]